jgi:hypothetical protein
LEETNMICDFCNAANPIWRFNARLFVLDYGPIVTASDAGWAACDACRNLILTGDRTGLVDRAVLFAPVIPGLPESEVRKLRRWAQGLFFAHRVPCEPTPIALLSELPLAVWAPSFIPRETHSVSFTFASFKIPSAWCGPPAGPTQKSQENNDDPEYRTVSGRTTGSPASMNPPSLDPPGDPASAIALTTQSLNGHADSTSLLSWDIMTGLSVVNDPGKQMLDSVFGEHKSRDCGTG